MATYVMAALCINDNIARISLFITPARAAWHDLFRSYWMGSKHASCAVCLDLGESCEHLLLCTYLASSGSVTMGTCHLGHWLLSVVQHLTHAAHTQFAYYCLLIETASCTRRGVKAVVM